MPGASASPAPLADALPASLAAPARASRLGTRPPIRLILGLGFIAGLYLAGHFLPLPYNPYGSDTNNISAGPSAAHWWGTDEVGADVFSRTIRAASTDLPLAVGGTALALLIGVPFGLLMGTNSRTAVSPLLQPTLAGYNLGIIDSTEAKAHATTSDPWARTWLGTHTAGFGPYMVDTFDPAKQISLVANKNYWRGAPAIPKIVMRAVPDAGSRAQLAISGEADYVDSLAAEQIKAVKDAGKSNVYSWDSGAVMYIGMQLRDTRLSDARVRRAISMSIDRQGIANIYPGAAQPAVDCVSPSIPHPAASKPLPAKPVVTNAKQLLSAAGYGNGMDLSLAISPSTTPGADAVARVIQNNWLSTILRLELERG